MSIETYTSFQKCGSSRYASCLACDYFCLILMILEATGQGGELGSHVYFANFIAIWTYFSVTSKTILNNFSLFF